MNVDLVFQNIEQTLNDLQDTLIPGSNTLCELKQ